MDSGLSDSLTDLFTNSKLLSMSRGQEVKTFKSSVKKHVLILQPSSSTINKLHPN